LYTDTCSTVYIRTRCTQTQVQLYDIGTSFISRVLVGFLTEVVEL